MATYIYRLIDPKTQEIRYVGKTRYPDRRLQEHIKFDHITPCGQWIAELVNQGLKPEMDIVATIPDGGDWQTAEIQWIAKGRLSGWPLLNVLSGGQGAIEDYPLVPSWIDCGFARVQSFTVNCEPLDERIARLRRELFEALDERVNQLG